MSLAAGVVFGGALSVPGKTFLVGEYLALSGGPALLISTEPRFSLKTEVATRESLRGRRLPFAPGSPASRFLQRHPRELSGVVFDFHDPYRAKGGLGASSAQFALLYAFARGATAFDPSSFDWRAMLEEYKQCAWNGEGLAPSGADVMSQMNGGITRFSAGEGTCTHLEWRFATLSFTLLRTGFKLATHEHLKRVQMAPEEALRAAVERATQAFAAQNQNELIAAVNDASSVLAESGLTAPPTLALLRDLRAQEWALASKGCGAMGADIVLVLHEASHAETMHAWATRAGYEVCGTLANLSAQGLEGGKK